jgi:acetyl esterase/lipase
MTSIFTYQPFKALYGTAALGFELARLPLWLIKYFTAYGRQHPEWTFKQALGVRIFFSAVYHLAVLQVKTPLLLTPGKEKERFIVINTAADKYYKGPLAPTEHVKPISIGGSWYPAPLTASSDQSSITVVLHIHGGAFVLGDGRTKTTGFFANKLLKDVGVTHVFVPQYRLASLPPSKTSNPFPAALQDSLTSYLYLVNELKISPSNIILSGDSAGANAAMSILRYIKEYGDELAIPAPAAALLWSPWVEPANTIHNTLANNPNYGTDYVSFPFTAWGSHAYAGFAGPSILASPYIGHKGKNKAFKTEVPLWVNVGGGEVLYFDGVEWAENMKEVGNNVTLDVTPNVPHDIMLVGPDVGFAKEAAVTAKRAGEWLRSLKK